MPSAMIIFSIVMSVLCFYFFKRICMLKKEDVSSLTPFSEWRAEKGVSIIFFVLFFIKLFAPEDTMFGAVLLNTSVVMTFVFYLLGLSFIEHLLKRRVEKSFSRKLIFIGISFASFLMLGLPFLVIAIIGATDGILDLRWRMQNR